MLFADGRVVPFDPGELQLKLGDLVTVDNEKDLNLGRVVYLVPNRRGESLRRVLSRIGPQDWMLIRRNQVREQEAFEICSRAIAEAGLPMKLVRVAYLHGGNKAIFYFCSDGRVDFRALVKRLAQELHVRIEMRQIGVRDESRILGGIGICGQQLCCSRFLQRLEPVSIKMAKNQGLALNPQKLSGVCGRLMCCLGYEDSLYVENRRKLPRPAETVVTPAGEGKVVELNVPLCQVKVQVGERVCSFTLEQLEAARRGVNQPPSPSPLGEEEPSEHTPSTKSTAEEPIGADREPGPAVAGREGKKKKRRSRGRRRRSRHGKHPASPPAGDGGGGGGTTGPIT